MSIVCLNAHNPGPMTGGGNNTYLIVGSTGSATLIDAGVGDARHLADIDTQLAAAAARLDRVVVTHGHRDHAAGAATIASAYPQALFLKFPWPDDGARFPVAWHPLADGDLIRVGDEEIAVIHTPGHAPDHIALWHEASRSAFTGDLLIATGSVMIQWSRGGNLSDYVRSLQRLLALAPRTILPAHGPRVDEPARAITAALEHRLMREHQVVAALAEGRGSVEAIVESIYDGLDPALTAAARETVRAHLEKLKAEGRVRDEAGRWTV